MNLCTILETDNYVSKKYDFLSGACDGIIDIDGVNASRLIEIKCP